MQKIRITMMLTLFLHDSLNASQKSAHLKEAKKKTLCVASHP